MLNKAISRFTDVTLEHVSDGPGGFQNVFVTFSSSGISIAERGKRLLEIEDFLIKNVSHNIRIWHVPIGDKNSLRKLRGVQL